MRPVLTVMLLLTVSLGWLVIDGDSRRDAVGKSRHLAWTLGQEMDARAMMKDIKQGLQAAEAHALATLAHYHAAGDRLHPQALNRMMRAEFGEPKPELARDLMRRAAEAGDPAAQFFYWRAVGAPDRETLLDMVAEGSHVAATRLLMDSYHGECEWDTSWLEPLEQAVNEAGTAELHGIMENARRDLAKYQQWQAENCLNPAL